MKPLIFIFVLFCISVTANADVISCPGKDLSYSVKKTSPRSILSSGGKKLTLNCLGSKSLEFIVSDEGSETYSYEGYTDSAAIRSLSYNFARLANFLREGEEFRNQESLLKMFLATLLTAKSANLTVEIFYDAKFGQNREPTIEGIGLK